MPKKVNRNPGIGKRGDKWQARAFFDGKEISKTFATQDEAVRWKREQERRRGREKPSPDLFTKTPKCIGVGVHDSVGSVGHGGFVRTADDVLADRLAGGFLHGDAVALGLRLEGKLFVVGESKGHSHL